MATPDFKGYLLWYFILQCAISTAAAAGFFAYGFLVYKLRQTLRRHRQQALLEPFAWARPRRRPYKSLMRRRAAGEVRQPIFQNINGPPTT